MSFVSQIVWSLPLMCLIFTRSFQTIFHTRTLFKSRKVPVCEIEIVIIKWHCIQKLIAAFSMRSCWVWTLLGKTRRSPPPVSTALNCMVFRDIFGLISPLFISKVFKIAQTQIPTTTQTQTCRFSSGQYKWMAMVSKLLATTSMVT